MKSVPEGRQSIELAEIARVCMKGDTRSEASRAKSVTKTYEKEHGEPKRIDFQLASFSHQLMERFVFGEESRSVVRY